jgi:hypothetical protein
MIEHIKQIINSDVLSDKEKRECVLSIISQDKDAINHVLFMLNEERKQKHELLTEMNLLLSKSYFGLENKRINKGGFIQQEIDKFYKKYKKFVGNCFKND